nr:N-acetyltransferase [uncultured Enterobacter sp.]
MIHPWRDNDTAPLLTLWLESTTWAHPFIDAQYWRESEAVVRDVYLPSAVTWVWEEKGRLEGFVSVMESRFVGALFVRPSALGRGIGRALLEHVKQRYAGLSLEVYQKNARAVNFYHALGFRIEDSAWQDETRHPTWIMSWQADQTPLA